MEITIWQDFACPFCYIGETQLEEIINKMNLSGDVKMQFRAYQLDPNAPTVPVESMTQHFMSEHGNTEEEAQHLIERITKMAARVGLDYKLATAQVCNTFDAHRLMKYAQDHASQEIFIKLNFEIFHANFIDNLRLSDHNVLLSIAENCALDKNEVGKMLESDMYGEQVRQDEKEINERKDFELIPYIVFDDNMVLQGVISPGAMKKALSSN
ncbi:MAG: DsbA family oxidoreductase [Bacteroides sp.]|nr:DsbA family oxidoreductase [Bacteroides sp.]